MNRLERKELEQHLTDIYGVIALKLDPTIKADRETITAVNTHINTIRAILENK